MEENTPLVSFITVVYNGVSELEPTIKSILSQTEKRFEYFIIDGGSADGTLDLIKKYESQLTGWVSEKDKGLYDAMNKAMKLAHGKYLWFMNAGDQVYSNDTLKNIFSSLPAPLPPSLVPRPSSPEHFPDVIYGETEIMDENAKTVGLRRLKSPEKLNWESLQWGMVVCHQSFLVQREKCPPYNLHYRLASDIDWMIRVLKDNYQVHNTGLILCKFKSGGLSQQQIRHGLKERFRIMVHYYGFFKTVVNHLVLGTKFFSYFLRHWRI